MKDTKRTVEEKQAVIDFYAAILSYLSIKYQPIVARDALTKYVDERKQHTLWHAWDTELLVNHIDLAINDACVRMQLNCAAFHDLADQMRNPKVSALALEFAHPPKGYQWSDLFASIQNERVVADWDPARPGTKVTAMTVVTTCPERVKELLRELGVSRPLN